MNSKSADYFHLNTWAYMYFDRFRFTQTDLFSSVSRLNFRYLWLGYCRRLGEVLRRKRYSKRPSRGKAASVPGTSDAYVEVNSQTIGTPSSSSAKTLFHESRASFLASQSSSRSGCRSSGTAERPAKVRNKLICYIPRLLLNRNEHCDWMILDHVPLIKFKWIPTGIQFRSCFLRRMFCCDCWRQIT